MAIKGDLLKDKVWYATPSTLENNVIQLHEAIFGVENYIPSEIVKGISKQVSWKSGVY